MILKSKVFWVAISILAFSLYSYGLYYLGKRIADNSHYIEQLEESIELLELQLTTQEISVEIITEYKDRIIEVEKKVPVYVNKVQKIFEYNDDIIIPSELARVHNEIICESNNANTACSFNGEPKRDVTLGEFARVVVENYNISKMNKIQLEQLQEWIRQQDNLINH